MPGHRQRSQAPRGYESVHTADTGDDHRYLSASQVGDGRAGALVRHLQDIQRCGGLHHLGGQLRRVAVAGRTVAQLARIAPRELDEFTQGAGLHSRMHHQRQRRVRDRPHRCQILDRIEGHSLEQARVDRQREVAHQQRVPVRRRLGDKITAQIGVGARLVFDQHLLAEHLAQLDRDLAGDNIGRAARRIRHHQANRALGEFLCRSRPRRKGKAPCCNHHRQHKRIRTLVHCFFPSSFVIRSPTTPSQPVNHCTQMAAASTS